MKQERLSREEYERLQGIAETRLAEFGMDEHERELFLGLSRENKAGNTWNWVGGWGEDQGVVAGATWKRSAIMEWLRDATGRS